MRELTGNLVAGRGAEPVGARTVADASRQLQCEQSFREQFRRKQDRAGHAPIGDESIGTALALDEALRTTHRVINDVPTDRVRSGNPITVFYAGAGPAFGMLD
jgi:hypothetical protein